MITLTPDAERLVPTRRMIFRRAQDQIDHVLATALPFDQRIEAAWDFALQAARDLDRLAAHEQTASVL
jgi:hypothetical protein